MSQLIKGSQGKNVKMGEAYIHQTIGIPINFYTLALKLIRNPVFDNQA